MAEPGSEQHGRVTEWILACLILVAGALLANRWLDIVPTRQRQVELLVAELREPGRPPRRIDQWLVKYGLMNKRQSRLLSDISDDLVRFGAAAVPELIPVLKDSDYETRANAAVALGRIGPDAKDAVPALIVTLKDKEERVRYCAAEALRRMGPVASDAASALAGALKDDCSDVRSSAAEVLVRIGPSAVPALVKALKEGDYGLRRNVFELLGRIGPAPSDAAGALAGLLNDGNIAVRLYAADALVRIGSPAVPALVEALKDKDENVRSRAAELLGEIGFGAKDAVIALVEALKDRYWIVRSYAAGALGGFGPAAKGAVPALIDALKDEQTSVRWRAAQALGGIGVDAKEAVRALTKLVKDEDKDVHEAAETALRKIQAPASDPPGE